MHITNIRTNLLEPYSPKKASAGRPGVLGDNAEEVYRIPPPAGDGGAAPGLRHLHSVR